MASRRTPRRSTPPKPSRPRTARPPAAPPTQSPGHSPGRLWVLEVPFEARAIATSAGARWDPDLRATTWRGDTLPTPLHPFAAPDFSWARFLEDHANNTARPVSPQPGFEPRPHQTSASLLITDAARHGMRGFLLADDVGLGKTLTAIMAINRILTSQPAANVLVLCPLAVVPHWRRSLAAHADTTHSWVVLNYDRVKHLLDAPESAKTAKRTATRNRRIARHGTPRVDWDVIVADEAHLLRNGTSQRTQAFDKLARYAAPTGQAPFVLWMSATAAQDPTEARYLTPLLAQLTGQRASALTDFGPWLASQGFHVHHDGRFDRWTWTDDPAERAHDVAILNQVLFANSQPVALRRLPTDIAGWPELQRILTPIDLTPPERHAYEQAWTEFRRDMRLAVRGRDPRGGLAAQIRFRQKASLIRAPGTAAHIQSLLDNELQVAVSVQFIESLNAIHDTLTRAGVSVAVIDGTGRYDRETERLRFQSGAASVVLFTVTEGISLHAGEYLGHTHATSTRRALVVHDPRYSGIASLQTEGRCHRDGQFAPAYYTFAIDTVEEDITRTLLGRIHTTKALVGDDVTTVRELENLLTRRALED